MGCNLPYYKEFYWGPFPIWTIVTNRCIAKYLGIIRNQNKASAETVEYYLKDFEVFCGSVLETTDKANPVSEVINKLKTGTWNDSPKEEQPYDVLGRCATWLVAEKLEAAANNERTINYKISGEEHY
jgi:hypothetical protein